MTFSGQEDRVGILKKLEEDFMKTMNMKKTVLAGVMAGAALYAFSFTAVPGNVQKMTRVQAEETAFTGSGEYNGILYENGEPFTGVKDRKYYVDGVFQSDANGWEKVDGKNII